MKIAVVGPVFPWRGGIAHHTGALLDCMGQHHDVSVISFRTMYPTWLYPGERSARIGEQELKETDHVRFLIKGSVPSTWREAVQVINQFRPDAVLVPWWTVFWAPFCLYITTALARRGIPVLYLCHNVLDHDARWWVKGLSRKALSRGTAFVTHTEQNRGQLQQWFPDAPVIAYPHPNYRRFPDPPMLPKRMAALELLFFGYVRRYKGVDILIEAVGRLTDLDFHLRIVGDFWIDKQPLQARIEELGIADRVTLVPHYVDDSEAGGLFTIADAVLLPYRKASSSGVAALALEYGTPVVGSRTGGLSEYVIDGETGFLVEPGDVQSLADGITRLLEPRDWSKRIAKHRSRISWQGLTDTIIEQIDQVTTRRLSILGKPPR